MTNKRAKAIMVQGTMSGAGKSLIAAGLCRVFAQDGLAVAPFKSQNMSLNSAVTPRGFEIGRAQALQAQACGIPTEPAMNPILLKPTTDVGSQVIVMGKPVANMAARDYFKYKTSLIPTVQAAYDDLASRHDVVVIEGAGSPAEINLKHNDIVNMGMAKMAAAPVLLVGNIDCGGVFAQLVGTHALLEDDERRMLKACVINKFRGDVTLLQPGLDELERRMGVPVAGVVPYTPLDLDDEDGFSAMQGSGAANALLDIAVVRLPHISNFTDLDALTALPEVRVRYVSHAEELGQPDLVVVPGTKATLGDLAWLRTCNLDAALRQHAEPGGLVLGICGGYQMLGLEIHDPLGVEGGGRQEGLRLLPVRTAFTQEKTLCSSAGTTLQLEGPFASLSNLDVAGYQIHMGQTTLEGGAPFCLLADAGDAAGNTAQAYTCSDDSNTAYDQRGRTPSNGRLSGNAGQSTYEDGCVAGTVMGTYLHGLFDSVPFTQALIDMLLARKGMTGVRINAQDRAARREQQLDMLADTLRTSLDMDLVYRILEEGI